MTKIALDKLLSREETYKEFAEAARHPLNVEFTKAECYRRFKFLAEEVDEVLLRPVVEDAFRWVVFDPRDCETTVFVFFDINHFGFKVCLNAIIA